MIDPQLEKLWSSGEEPQITFKLTNVTARETLVRLLDLRNLALNTNSPTGIAHITRKDESANVVNGNLIEMETNAPVRSATDIIPLIIFSGVPLDVCLENLIRQADIKVEFDPHLINAAADGVALFINLRWENVTAKQAIVALCENYDLVIAKDDSGSLHIKPLKTKKHHRLKLR
ncbi:MAG: hypothetical protein RL616_2049 [Verrucomicrobiota bacterium]